MKKNTIKFLPGFFFLIILNALLLTPQKINAQVNHPNVIFILGDDIGYEIPTVDGGKSYQTPNIDRMAKQGMRFTQ